MQREQVQHHQGDRSLQHLWSAHLLSYVMIILPALLLRVVDLGGFTNEDEIRYWLSRSQQFLEAIQSGNFGATAISTHPGVTTMWCGSIGIVLRRTLLAWGVFDSMGFPTRLMLMRLPAEVIHVCGILVGYFLLRRMFPASIALFAAFLWATDPFIIAFSRMLHVDGLAMTFATVSLLAACYYWNHRPSWPWLIVSAACAGLAIMSKSPALVVVPVVGLLALKSAFVVRQRWITPLIAWLIVCATTIFIVWPALWVDPMRVYHLLRVGVEVEGGSPHVQGNFFLGQEDDEPDWRFYPVALAMRTTPWTLAGLLMLTRAMLPHWNKQRNDGRDAVCCASPLTIAMRSDIAIITVFCILFITGMSIFPKKLNRYLIPIFPSIDLLASIGLIWTIETFSYRKLIPNRFRMAHTNRSPIVMALFGIALINAIWYHPYHITYFNQLLGGTRAGAETFLIGAGEGLEQVADWLNQRPDITGVATVTTMPPPLQAYLRDGAYAGPPNGTKLPKQTGYVVVYVRNVWGHALPPFDQFYRRVPPIHTVSIHGIEYAWIYHVPQPLANKIQTNVGTAIQLHSYDIQTSSISSTGTIWLTLQWYVQEPITEDYHLFVHFFNVQGQQVGQIDVPPGGPESPTHTWLQYSYVSWVHPMPVPKDLPPGSYWVGLGLYRTADFARLPVKATSYPGTPDDGPNVLFLAPIEIKNEP